MVGTVALIYVVGILLSFVLYGAIDKDLDVYDRQFAPMACFIWPALLIFFLCRLALIGPFMLGEYLRKKFGGE